MYFLISLLSYVHKFFLISNMKLFTNITNRYKQWRGQMGRATDMSVSIAVVQHFHLQNVSNELTGVSVMKKH